MEYYVIKPDDRFDINFTIINFLKDYGDFEKPVVKYITKKRNFIFTDYIIQREFFDMHHLFSNTLKEIISMYNQNARFKAIFITEEDGGSQRLYWDVFLPRLDCVFIERRINISNIKLYANRINNSAIFSIEYEKQNYIVARTDALESMLRRYPLGLSFVKAKILI